MAKSRNRSNAASDAFEPLPHGWTESAPGQMATNPDPERGGIIDFAIATGQWFAIPNNEAIAALEGFPSRAAAMTALEEAIDAFADSQRPMFQRVFHGTPYRNIEREGFDLNRIGTGEGAHAFGWGMYFAGMREVGESYRRSLGRPELLVDGQVLTWEESTVAQAGLANDIASKGGDLEAVRRMYTQYGGAEAGGARVAKARLAALNELERKGAISIGSRKGQLYHADIPEDSDLLDWEKPLSEQPEKVRAALKGLIGSQEPPATRPVDSMTGESIYRHLTDRLGGARAASEALHSAGIPGLRYLDGGSRYHRSAQVLEAQIAKYRTRLAEETRESLLADLRANLAALQRELDKANAATYNYVIWDAAVLTPESAGITPYYSRKPPAHSGDEVPDMGPSEPTAETDQLARRLAAYSGKAVRIEAIRHVPDSLAPVFEEFERVFDTRVHLVRNLTPESVDFDGVTLREGHLFVNAAAKSPTTTTLAHEMVHQLRKDRPDLYEELAAEVRRQGDIPGYLERLRAMEDANAAAHAVDLRVAEEELVADLAGDAMSDPQFLNALASRNRPLFGRLAVYFGTFLDRIRDTWGRVRTLESTRFLRDVDTFRELLKDVVERYALDNAEARVSGDRFYSALARAVDSAEGAPRRAAAAAWKGWLDGAQRRGAFRLEERQWMGLDAWLDGREVTTREELQAFVAQHSVRIEERWLGGRQVPPISWEPQEGGWAWKVRLPGDRDAVLRVEYDGAVYRPSCSVDGGPIQRLPSHQDLPAAQWAAVAALRDVLPDFPRYARYQLPGGDNYRELLLTVPGEASAASFRSSHYDEPNLLVWVRMNDRVGPKGERYLHVEEIQSDWHQKGRAFGYQQDVKQELAELREDRDRKRWESLDAALAGDAERGVGLAHDADAIAEQIGGARAQASRGVPDAPFKRQWVALAVKRVLQVAAEEGYDGITWTDGAHQVARYQLERRLKSVYARRVSSTDILGQPVVTYELTVEGPYETLFDTGGSPEHAEHLAQFVGKDLADRIVAEVTEEGTSYDGLDMVVGGEGLRTFYDRILPAVVNDLVKPWGGRVDTSKLKESTGLVPAPHLSLTPAMRLAALDGLPMFSRPQPTPEVARVVSDQLDRIRSQPEARPGRGRPLMHGRVRSKSKGTQEEIPRSIDEWIAALGRHGVRVLGMTSQPNPGGGEVAIIDLGAGCSVRDAGNTLLAARDSEREIACMIAIAREKGWKEVSITGSRRFQRRATKAFAAAGVAVQGQTVPDDRIKAQAGRNAAPSQANAPPALRTRATRAFDDQPLAFDADSSGLVVVESSQPCWCCDKETPVFAIELQGIAEFRDGSLDSAMSGSVGGPLLWITKINGDAVEAISALGGNWQSRETEALEGMPYYANVCPHCDAVQGDHFLHDEGGAFGMSSTTPVRVHRLGVPLQVQALEMLEYPEGERLSDRPAFQPAMGKTRFGR